MLRGSLAPLLRQLRLVTDATNGQLLQRFAVDRDEVAFAELVRRHGPLVWKVCSQVLGHEQDAEDAFQAAFLVLACKAGGVRKQESLGSWLHGVAYRTAMKARTESARRKTREQRVTAATAVTSDPGPDRDELAILHEEIQRLPAKYRLSVVLCFLEGQTRTQAARQLGWKEGTVAGRLAEAKKLLRRRLQRRGVTLAAGSLAAALVEGQGSASAPVALAASTVRAALLFAAGETAAAGVLSARVVALADKVGRALLLSKCQTGMAVLLALTVLAAGATLIARSATPGHPEVSQAESALIQADQQPAEQPVRTDRYGDPLPPGAIARLGTIRFRHACNLASIAFAPDGKLVGTGDDHLVRLWDLATGKELAHFGKTYSDGLCQIAFSPDGKIFAAAAHEERICLFDANNRKVIREIRTKELGANPPLTFSPDGKTLSSAGESGVVRLWEVATGKEVLQLKGHQGMVRSVAFSPDGKMLASSGADATVRLWDVVTGKELHQLPGSHGDETREFGVAVAFSPKGHLLASVREDRTVCFWDPATGKEMRRLPAAVQLVHSVAFSPDGQVLAVASGEMGLKFGGGLVLWHVNTAKMLRKLSDARHGLVAFSPDGKLVAAGGGGSSTLHLWETATGKELFADLGHQAAVHSVAFAADGRRVVTGSEEVRLWDATSGRELGQYAGDRPRLTPDGKALITFTRFTEEPTVHLWDVASGEERRKFPLPPGSYVPAISPDGKTLAWGDQDYWIHLWDVAEGKELRRLANRVQGLSGGVFSPDGRILALSLVDHAQLQTWLWNVASGKVVSKLAGRSFRPAFSPDGKLIAATAADHLTLRLWDTATGRELRAWQTTLAPPVDAQVPEMASQEQEPVSVCFSPDGRTLATGNRINQVRLWEVATGKNRLLFDGQRGWPCFVHSLAFSPDGKLLASGALDAAALVWALDSGLAAKGPVSDEALNACWADLLHEDAARAYRAMWQLVASGARAVALLKDHLRPVSHIDPDRIARLLGDLNSGAFAVRDRAEKELENLGDVAESALRKAGANSQSAEARRRMEGLLSKLEEETRSGEPLRALRAVEVLEQIGTPEARQLLQQLAAGAPEARLTGEAAESLDRLAKRVALGQP
jgi:RNA polymerase sigma factor (sigma-70 family)